LNAPARPTKPFSHLFKGELEDTKTSCQICVVSAGPDHKKSYPLTAGRIVKIGCDPSNHLTLTDDYVSGFHLELELREGQVHVQHLSKTNPTLIHGKPVHSVRVKEETEISIGRSRLRLLIEKRPYWANIVGGGPKMVEAYQQLQRAAESDENVLILGERGAGKEIVARAIHWLSSRFNAPCIAKNCSILKGDSIESDLFGHEKGAFTGADKRHEGFFEQAHKGTLFLDEIGDIPFHLQPEFLRVLEGGQEEYGRVQSTLRKVCRKGGVEEIDCDVRVITATNRDLNEAIQKEQFRADLFDRIRVLTVFVPPLREHKEDIPDLVNHFLLTSPVQMTLTPAAMEKLKAYSWPGNVRELRGVLEQARASVSIRKENTIEAMDILIDPDHAPPSYVLNADERILIQNVLDECRPRHKNKGLALEEAAKCLDIKTSTLYARIKQLKLKW
jgi:transcriptional regulator with PAS, ATPase and Fis domain